MNSEYHVVKDPAKLREFMGLDKDRYLEDHLEPELASFLDDSKKKQRSGKKKLRREDIG
jgi:hypothetical protein